LRLLCCFRRRFPCLSRQRWTSHAVYRARPVPN
jgi:hypothetical protein